MVEKEPITSKLLEETLEVTVMIGGMPVTVVIVEPGGIGRLEQEELQRRLAQGGALPGLTGRDLLPDESGGR